MNLFLLDEDPGCRAMLALSCHTYWLAKECCQMLSTAFYRRAGKVLELVDPAQSPPYKVTLAMWSHPWARWARTNRRTYSFVVEHASALLREDAVRRGKPCVKVTDALAALQCAMPVLSDGGLPPIPLCFGAGTPCYVPTLAEAVAEYRRYYAGEKVRLAKAADADRVALIQEWL